MAMLLDFVYVMPLKSQLYSGLFMNSKINQIVEELQKDENSDLYSSICAAYLEDEQRGATMIVSFASERGTELGIDQVVDYINEMDDDDWDIELTPEMLTSVAGGKRCRCEEEAHDEPWGRCPGMRPMRKWLFGGC